MKFLVQIGLVAVTLFSVSAALSVWLYQSKQPTEDAAKADEKTPPPKGKGKEPDRTEAKEPPEGKSPKSADPVTAPGLDPTALATLRDREARLERRAAQLEIVVGDLRAERESLDALMRQATEELKAAAARTAEAAVSPKTTADAAKAKSEAEAAEAKHIATMVRLYEAMAPETAAPILRQMTDGGKLDTVARVLAQMKERQAARILGEFGDTSLAAQLLGRMRQLNPTPGSVPPGGLPPAGTPANLPPIRPTP